MKDARSMGTGGSCAARETTATRKSNVCFVWSDEYCRKHGDLLGADERKTEQYLCA